ncbi:MAG: ABC transporter substrate-binding protein [Acidimicrobiia bacterium]
MGSKRHRAIGAVLAPAALLLSAACGGGDSDGAAGGSGSGSTRPPSSAAFPVEVENCGRTLTFEQAPTRTIGLDQISTELLLHLGVADAIVGTANQSDPPFEGVATEFDGLEVLSANYPTAEQFVAAEADFVVGNLEFLSYSQESGFGGPFTRDQLEEQGVASFALICNGEEDTTETLFERFEQLGRIYGVADTAAAVLADVQASLDATAEVLDGVEPVPTLIYIDGTGPIQTLGSELERAGGRNIIGPDEGGCCPPEIGVEVVVDRDPAAILISSFGNLDPSGPTLQDKQRSLASVLPTTEAVQAERYLPIDFIAFSTPSRLASDVNRIGAFLHPDLEFPS